MKADDFGALETAKLLRLHTVPWEDRFNFPHVTKPNLNPDRGTLTAKFMLF
jgi:hypothetical protein